MDEKLDDLFTQAQFKCMEGDFDAGIALFSEIIEKSPDTVKAYQARAVCYFKQDNDQLALQDIEAALSKEPDNAKLLYQKAAILLKSEKMDDALDAANKAIEKDSVSPTFYFLRSKIFEKLGNEERANADMSYATMLQKEKTSKLVDW